MIRAKDKCLHCNKGLLSFIKADEPFNIAHLRCEVCDTPYPFEQDLQLAKVNKEQATKLKQAGFHLKTQHYFIVEDDEIRFDPEVPYDWNSNTGYSAPSIPAALKWLREVYRLFQPVTTSLIDEYEKAEFQTLTFLLSKLPEDETK